MGRLRLLRVGGNLGLAVHGPRADRLLAACPVDDPWCRLARVDRALLVSELGLGDQRESAAARARELLPLLPAAAAMRLSWAGQPAPVPPAAPASPQDPWAPVAAALAEQGGMPRGPGTWLLGLGVIGARGLGAGPLLRFSHPDLGWRAWTLEAEAWGTSAGAFRARAGLRTRGLAWFTTGAAAGRQPVPLYDEAGALLSTGEVMELQARLAPGLALGPASAWLGPLARVDRPAGAAAWTPGHGLFGGVGLATTAPPSPRLVLSGELSLAGPAHLALQADARAAAAVLRGTGALRLVGAAAPLSTSPTWRAPAWGGGEVLRGAPLGRLRAPWMTALVPEWRRRLVGPLGLVLFAEGAATGAGALHGGGGGGLRLHLPPQPGNTVRLDLAASDLGWSLSAGWGEAF